MTLSPGTRLGPYEVLAPLGAGGMGEVWKARDTRLGRIVAIKRLAATHTDRFEQEARAIATLNHPHICQIHDVGPDYLVLEYIEGQPLHGPFPADRAVALAIQIAGALEEAHSRSILHRDLKPANIMVTPRGDAKLLDFGLAKLVSTDADVTRTFEGAIVGTAAYMSPEQAEGKAVDARSDIFSFGAVLYEMLCGRRAFGGRTTLQVVQAVVRDDPPALTAPPALERIVRRCLQKAPAQRFQTMAEVKAALEHSARDRLAATSEGTQPSIAVLPFADMSAAKDYEWFSDGLTEEIINGLAHIPGLNVTARTSAFAFRGREQDIRTIAEALNVRTILEGSVRRAGSRVRVTAQLINAEDGYHLWSERYDREVADVFAMQDDIAQAIAAALQVKLSATSAVSRRYTPNVAAYEAYLKGLHYGRTTTLEARARAGEYLKQAVTLDPGFALAHAVLARHFLALGILGWMPVRDAMPLVGSEARHALDLDPSLPEAHATLGRVAALYDYDWTDAEWQFGQAMAHDPVPAEVRVDYGLYLELVGRPRDGVEQLERALREDPLNAVWRYNLGHVLTASGRDMDAEVEFLKALELDENCAPAIVFLSLIHLRRGALAEALVFAERAHALAPVAVPRAALAGMLALAGDASRADALRQQLEKQKAYAALAISYFPRIDQAADWMEKAIEQRDPLAIVILLGPGTEVWRSSPRWPALAKMINLPEHPRT